MLQNKINLNMKTITFNIPDTVDIDKNEASMLFASKLYEKGKLSWGRPLI